MLKKKFICPLCKQPGNKSTMRVDRKTICTSCSKDFRRQLKQGGYWV